MNISICQTDRRTASSAVAKVVPFITVIHDAVRRYIDKILWCHKEPFQYRIDVACMLGILHTKLIWKLTILSASRNNNRCFVDFAKKSKGNILKLTCEREQL